MRKVILLLQWLRVHHVAKFDSRADAKLHITKHVFIVLGKRFGTLNLSRWSCYHVA